MLTLDEFTVLGKLSHSSGDWNFAWVIVWSYLQSSYTSLVFFPFLNDCIIRSSQRTWHCFLPYLCFSLYTHTHVHTHTKWNLPQFPAKISTNSYIWILPSLFIFVLREGIPSISDQFLPMLSRLFPQTFFKIVHVFFSHILYMSLHWIFLIYI